MMYKSKFHAIMYLFVLTQRIRLDWLFSNGEDGEVYQSYSCVLILMQVSFFLWINSS